MNSRFFLNASFAGGVGWRTGRQGRYEGESHRHPETLNLKPRSDVAIVAFFVLKRSLTSLASESHSKYRDRSIRIVLVDSRGVAVFGYPSPPSSFFSPKNFSRLKSPSRRPPSMHLHNSSGMRR